MQETLFKKEIKTPDVNKNATVSSENSCSIEQTEAKALNSALEYRVLARKYRPQLFAQLIGQEVLVQTLKNAFLENRIHHAFILTGTRGVGKTTTARIIAKALNCNNLSNGYEPCGTCDSCLAITKDQHQDVIEIDAASNTGVDSVREMIIENSMFRPVSAKYKVFIIDEVHMLSKSAFNALLKTLEEPPEHTKFIFATTEVRKIPITILSRCQRFDLRRVGIEELYKHFTEVCKKEQVQANETALKMIASSAKGSVRDGLSMLDQAISLSLGNITKEVAQEMLGNADVELIISLMHNIVMGKLESAIQVLEKLHELGTDSAMILEDLCTLLHNITRYKILKVSNFSVSEKEMSFCKEMAEQLSFIFLTRAWQVMQTGLKDLADSSFASETLEIIVIKLHIFSTESSPEDMLSIESSTSSAQPAEVKKNF